MPPQLQGPANPQPPGRGSWASQGAPPPPSSTKTPDLVDGAWREDLMESWPAAQRRGGEEGPPVVGSGVGPPPAPQGPKPWPRHRPRREPPPAARSHRPAGRGAFRSHRRQGSWGAPPALLRLRCGGCAFRAPGAPAGTHCNLPRGRQGALSRPAVLAPRGRRRGRGCDASAGRRGDGATGRRAPRAGGRRGAAGAMGNLFGRKKQSRVTEQDRAILVRPGARAGPAGEGPRGAVAGSPSPRSRGGSPRGSAGAGGDAGGAVGEAWSAPEATGPGTGSPRGALAPVRRPAPSGSRGPAAPAGICFRGLPLPWGRRCAPASGAPGVGAFPWEEETWAQNRGRRTEQRGPRFPAFLSFLPQRRGFVPRGVTPVTRFFSRGFRNREFQAVLPEARRPGRGCGGRMGRPLPSPPAASPPGVSLGWKAGEPSADAPLGGPPAWPPPGQGWVPAREGGRRPELGRARTFHGRASPPTTGRPCGVLGPAPKRPGRAPLQTERGACTGSGAHPAARWLGAMPPETRAPPGGGLAWTRGGHSRCSVRLLPGLRKVTCCPLGRVSDRSGELSPRLEAGPALGG